MVLLKYIDYYDKLVNQDKAIDTNRFPIKVQYDTGKLGIEKKIDNIDKKNTWY